jgi:AraC family transcriptional regulator
MRLIESRFAEQLPIHDIAREAGISTAHIHALFQARFGTSPHQKLTDVRLSEARRLLASTRRSIKDIAASVGYPDAASFCKLFKARCGFRPLEYRQRHIRKDGEGFSPETAPVQPV